MGTSPFLVRNYSVSNEFRLTTSQSGFNLYLGNNPNNPYPYYQPVSFASSSPLVQGTQFNIEASRRTGRKLTPAEASEFWTRTVLNLAVDHPWSFFRKLILKSAALINRYSGGDHYNIGFLSSFATFFKLPLFPRWLILPIGLTGLIISCFHSFRAVALGLISALYAMSLVLFFNNSRYFLPLMVVFIPYACIFLKHLVTRFQSKAYQKILPGLAAAIVFYGAAFLPIAGSGDLSAYYNTHANILNKSGRTSEAIQYWQIPAGTKQRYSDFSCLSLAIHHFKNQDFRNTVHYLNLISADSYAGATKFALMGDLFQITGQIQQAYQSYRQSMQINSGQLAVQAKIVRLLQQTDRTKVSKELEQLRNIATYYPESRLVNIHKTK